MPDRRRACLIVGLLVLLSGTMWMASARNLQEGWITFTSADGLADNGGHAMAIDSAGNWWFSTWDSGASGLDYGGTPFNKGDDNWITFTTVDGLAVDSVIAINASRLDLPSPVSCK